MLTTLRGRLRLDARPAPGEEARTAFGITAMHRIWRVSGWGTLSSLPLPSTASQSMRTTCLATAAHRSSSTVPRRGKNTEWIRGKLWKGAPPGPDDPYRQREEQEEVSSLPDEATSKRLRRETTPAAVLASGLKLPPRRSEALTEQALQAADPTYVPATEAEGLEEILPAKMWWDQDGHWGPESEFNAFGRAEKAADKEVIEVCLRRAVVEVLALQESGSFAEWASKKWREGRRSDMDQALAMEIRVKDGNASLEDGATSVVEALTAEAEDTAASEMPTREEAKAFIQAWDPSWKEIRLEDEAKFAVWTSFRTRVGDLLMMASLSGSKTALPAYRPSNTRCETWGLPDGEAYPHSRGWTASRAEAGSSVGGRGQAAIARERQDSPWQARLGG